MYDTETGLYYLQSRYYDAEIGRFVCVDNVFGTGTAISGNLFGYCGNSVTTRKDPRGHAAESIWDLASFGYSIIDVVRHPDDVTAWAGLAGDALDLALPFFGGAGESIRALRIADRVTDGLGDLSKAAEYGIQSYNKLRKALSGTGLQAHHIVEQRLVKHLGIDVNQMLSVAVTPAEHQKFTNAWRELVKYGTDYSTLTPEKIYEYAQEVYKDYPELIEASYQILFTE